MDVRRAQGVHLEIVLGNAVHGGGLSRAGEKGEQDGGAEFHHSTWQD
ncbi:hypothetical protein HF282_13685 [Acidithiobacillus ferrooxidans]|nr:hypothetical protein [Acidithiobacillus ferrooxidans]